MQQLLLEGKTIETEKEKDMERERVQTVKTPPIMAQTFVMKCEKNFGFSVIRT